MYSMLRLGTSCLKSMQTIQKTSWQLPHSSESMNRKIGLPTSALGGLYAWNRRRHLIDREAVVVQVAPLLIQGVSSLVDGAR